MKGPEQRQGENGPGQPSGDRAEEEAEDLTGTVTGEPAPQLERGTAPMPIKADAEPLITVFEHLIRNAQDGTPIDGTIDVEAGISDGRIKVSF